jgi:hypothetical protein
MGPKCSDKKREHGALIFHTKGCFQHLPLEDLTQQELETFAGGFAGVTQSENISLRI